MVWEELDVTLLEEEAYWGQALLFQKIRTLIIVHISLFLMVVDQGRNSWLFLPSAIIDSNPSAKLNALLILCLGHGVLAQQLKNN